MRHLLHTEIPIAIHPVLLTSLVIILLLGFDLRLESVLHTKVVGPVRADARDYVLYAFNLRNHGVYTRSDAAVRNPGAVLKPDAIRSPGYPLFLALFMDRLPDGRLIRTILVVQVLLSVLVIGIGYALFRHFLDPPGAAVAAGLTAISPHLVTANIYLLSETLFTFLLVTGFWVFVTAQRRRACGLFVLAGAVFAAASLTRPGVQYFLPMLVLLMYWQWRDRKALKSGGFLLLGFIIVMTPWLIRNLLAIGATSDPTLMINFLHHGIYPGFMYHGDPRSFGFPYRFDPHSAEISRSIGSVLHEIIARFLARPGIELQWFLIGKPVTFWSWSIVGGLGDVFVYPVASTPYTYLPQFVASHWLMYYLHWPLVISGLAGAVLAWWPRFTREWNTHALRTVQAFSLLIFYSTLIHMVGAPFPRYSIPLRPFLFALATVPWIPLVRRAIELPGRLRLKNRQGLSVS